MNAPESAERGNLRARLRRLALTAAVLLTLAAGWLLMLWLLWSNW